MAQKGIGNAGEFSLDLVEIIAADGATLGITHNVLELDIYEDIEKPILTGKIAFNDPVNFMNTLPVVGQEYFKIKVKTPSFEKQEEMIEHLFFAYTISGQEELTTTNQVVVMHLIKLKKEISLCRIGLKIK